MNILKRTILSVFALLLSLSVILGMTPGKNSKIAVETVVLSPGNTAPIAENMELSTYRDTVITGQLKAVDAENEQIFFEITKNPKHGEVTLYDDGSFMFDPCGTKKSKVTFSYIAADASGNKSEEAEVIIHIEKQSCDTVYSDVSAEDEYYAVFLAENGIYTGQCIGEECFFRPERNVTKAELLSMCLTATEHVLLTDVTRTGLTNDSELPVWVKNCVSTAVLCGCYTCNDAFDYDGSITYEEAAVMINDVFEITDVISVSAISPYFRESSAQAVNNLYFCGITDESIVGNYDKPVTMADAARMLTNAMTVFNNR